ncbi:acyl-CoA thioester hydrolase [Loktanella ponticola]|uniref:Acyl-CoA thioester hydrolase n=1 Tax=Yoonia ponticola TaxID=1524255 RepID=A0A7W9EY65_9RHOB|nr:tol-pal system-associated acyl-CoA thioesterase [Yoonia ponticola]MBB5722453.1 acyl-CoA thioester hydrolase [Yoonia ponticola]
MTHQFPVKVYYEDTDMGGVVYYANYLRFIERARSEIVEELGVDQNAMKADGLIFVVTRVVADYLAPARLGDVLFVKTDHRVTSPLRWVFDQAVWRGDQCLFKAEVTAVCMTVAGRPTRLPAELRARLA